MPDFRQLLSAIDADGGLLRVSRTVNPKYELGALLKQAEARRKAILFESVAGAAFPVAGGLLTDPQRFAQGLGDAAATDITPDDRDAHRRQVAGAIARPLPAQRLDRAPCKENAFTGDAVSCGSLPVPTFFAGDTGPFLTAAVGISRNPDNGVLNAGIYRVLMLDDQRMVVSIGPGSGLLGFIAKNRAAGKPTELALVIGAEPALLMAASARVPADISELDVAGALCGAPLEVIAAELLDLDVPANSEIVIETVIDGDEAIPNTMGEFGDLYGGRDGPVARAVALSHRDEAIFHTIMAGAGKEHNSLGFIILYDIEPALRASLAESHPDVVGVRVLFEPPKMGMTGEVYLQLQRNSAIDGAALIRHVLNLHVGGYDLGRVIRRVVLVGDDIDIASSREITWAVNNRALTQDRHVFVNDLQLPGVGMRMGVDARVAEADYERLQRLTIPGADAISLDDYLD